MHGFTCFTQSTKKPAILCDLKFLCLWTIDRTIRTGFVREVPPGWFFSQISCYVCKIVFRKGQKIEAGILARSARAQWDLRVTRCQKEEYVEEWEEWTEYGHIKLLICWENRLTDNIVREKVVLWVYYSFSQCGRNLEKNNHFQFLNTWTQPSPKQECEIWIQSDFICRFL